MAEVLNVYLPALTKLTERTREDLPGDTLSSSDLPIVAAGVEFCRSDAWRGSEAPFHGGEGGRVRSDECRTYTRNGTGTIPEGKHLTKNLTAEHSKLAIFRRFLAVVGPSNPMWGERQKPYQKMQKNKRTAALGSFFFAVGGLAILLIQQ